MEQEFAYDLGEPLEELRRHFGFDVSCQGTVPPALIAFLESTDFEDAIRKAISLGGDSDTLACIAGGMAHAFYGSVPLSIRRKVYAILNAPMRHVAQEFCVRFSCD